MVLRIVVVRYSFSSKQRLSSQVSLKFKSGHPMPHAKTIIRMLLPAILAFASLSANAQSNQNSPLGMNLAPVTYYTPEQPFLDIFKTGWTVAPYGWITQVNGGTWDTGEENLLRVDSSGWVTTLAPKSGSANYNQVGILLERSLNSPYYPGGQYIVTYDGAGTINYSFDAVKNLALSTPGHDVINVTPSAGGIWLYITTTDPQHVGNYIRNIHVVQAAYESNFQAGAIFNPAFLSAIAPFKTLRFMDWGATNFGTLANWTDRPLTTDAFWDNQVKGVPIEIMIALANQLNADVWYNVPYQATDTYVNNAASLIYSNLGSNQHLYLEYSNEVWNGAFPSGAWMQAQGTATWPSQPNDFNQTYNYYGMRVAQICSEWKQDWGASSGRVVCLMGEQTGNPGVATKALQCTYWSGAPCGNKYGITAMAIAGYFGPQGPVPSSWFSQSDGGLSSLCKAFTQGGYDPSAPSGYIQYAMGLESLEYNDVAVPYNLEMFGYEGGPGLVSSDPSTQALFLAFDQSSCMQTVYTNFLTTWKAAGYLHRMNHYNDFMAPQPQYGLWGALWNIFTGNSNPLSSPTYNALINFISANPCWWSGCGSTTNSTPPTPSVPTGLTGTVASATQINLSWNASTDNSGTVTGYNVFRSGTKVGTTASTSYSDTGLSVGNNYAYTVSAYDAAGNTSAQSSSISVSTPTPPALTITSPLNGTLLKGNSALKIATAAIDSSGIASISITSGSTPLTTCSNTTACSALMSSSSIAQGAHVISATATNKWGLQASASITILSLK